MRSVHLLRTALVLTALTALPTRFGDAAVLQAWTQYVDGGTVEARAITDDPACPSATLDGRSVGMTERHHPDDGFSVRTCVAPIAATVRAITIGAIHLTGPVARPQRIVVIGDTGCRLKGAKIQACNDPDAWPFAQVARAAAAEHPDLVIHVGDYFYREAPCPEGNAGCAGTPFGDTWAAWKIDVFTPATPLLQSATWLAERGNHEDCARGGGGWTAFFGWGPASGRCTPHEAPLVVDLGGVLVGVLDDNDSDDKPKQANPAIAGRMHADLATLLASHPDWLLTHHPVRGVSKKPDAESTPQVKEGYNATLDAALHDLPENQVGLHLSGHIHNFQIANYADPALPPQLVAGMGGDYLDTDVPADFRGLKSGPAAIADGLSLPGFGYLVMQRQSDGWAFDVHAVDGTIERHCNFKDRVLHCD